MRKRHCPPAAEAAAEAERLRLSEKGAPEGSLHSLSGAGARAAAASSRLRSAAVAPATSSTSASAVCAVARSPKRVRQ